MNLVQLTASRFFGGPERQMLGLAEHLGDECRTVFAAFSEDGLCREFLGNVSAAGFEVAGLRHDTPHLIAACAELRRLLRTVRADILVCHGYKACLIGLVAARQVGIPVVAVSRGWTAESVRVRLYEVLDRRALRWMDRVVCVSRAQAEKVRRAGVTRSRIVVIPNAVDPERFKGPHQQGRAQLEEFFPTLPRYIVGAAGRLSPEKGFDVLLEAASEVVRHLPSVGFVLFGNGRLRGRLEERIAELGLGGSFALPGFRGDLDVLLPHLDLFVQSSHTEGMPNVILEALAAGVPIVATAVGGTPELVENGISGRLVAAGNAAALTREIVAAIGDEPRRKQESQRGRQRLESQFTFSVQAAAYRQMFEGIRIDPGVTGAAISRTS